MRQMARRLLNGRQRAVAGLGMTPWDVADVVARRARRAASEALFRVRSTTDARTICAAYGVTSIHELPTAALSAPCAAWCGVENRRRTVDALKTVDGAVSRAIQRAEAAAALRFNIFGTHVSFEQAGRIDWSLDPISGHRYPALPAENFPLIREGSDPKYPWVLGRLDHLIALAQGYWVSNEKAQRARYAQLFVGQARDFLYNNPIGVGVQWTCAMEVALRAANLAQALRMFADADEAREPSFVAELLASIADHCAWVEAHLEDTGRVPNNHLVSNYAGVLVASALFPELPGAVQRIALSVRGLRAQMNEQVHPDGWSFEGSIPYHRLAVELFTLPYVIAHTTGIDLGSAYAERLQQMFKVSLNYSSPNGRAAQIGDNDSGRVFPLCDRDANDHGYLPSLGAALFCEAELRRDEPLCDEGVWLLGGRGLSRYERLPSRAQPSSMRSDRAGLHVLRTDDAVVTISAGPNGQKNVGGHNHNDKLGFELHVNGEPVIVDPGTGAYTRSASQRNLFRGTRAHATVQIDGLEQNPLDHKRLFLLEDRTKCRVLWFEGEGERRTLTARHEGFPGIQVERRFELHNSARALLVTDLLKGSGVHTVLSRFPLASTEARIRQATAEEQKRAGKIVGERWGQHAVVIGAEDAPSAVLLFQEGARPSLEPAEYSPGYGEVEPSVTVTLAVRAQLPRALAVCVLWGASTN